LNATPGRPYSSLDAATLSGGLRITPAFLESRRADLNRVAAAFVCLDL
jgi:hypothetical protein